MRVASSRLFWILLALGVWLGLVLAISFMEAPLKFQAPGITTELGLGIGRLVFGAMNKIELVLGLIVAVAVAPLLKRFGRAYTAVLAALGGVLLLQSFHLLPILDARAVRIIAGDPPADSWHHLGYVILEAVKVPLLITLFVMSYRRLACGLPGA